MLKGVEINVKGRVQGVFYRASTKNKAKSLNLTGTVQNNPDGSVSIKAYGYERELLALIDWCKVGPELALVENITFNWIEHIEAPGFEIKN